MKKILTLFFVLLLCLCAFAENSYRVFFPALKEVPIYPTDKQIGQLSEASASSSHVLIAKALKQPFTFEWCEQFIASRYRKNLTTLYSQTLSKLLPANTFMLSGLNKNADGTTSITVKFPETGDILLFVISENFIIGINNLKK